MRRQLLFLSICIYTICTLTACAQSKKTKSKGTGEAYARIASSTISKNENEPITYAFYVVWKKKETPVAFYWRGEDGWTDCIVDKVQARYETTTDKNFSTTKQVYTTERENFPLDSIKAGHYLKVITLPGGKNVIPSEIPATAKNRLYFKTANSGWLYITK